MGKYLIISLLSLSASVGVADTLFDTLVYKEWENRIEESPLNSIVIQENLSDLFRPLSECTVRERCYTAHWKIAKNILHLQSVRERGGANVPLSNLFPESIGPVKAHWYSGMLRVHTGRKIIVCDSESILVLEIADGILMREYYECT